MTDSDNDTHNHKINTNDHSLCTHKIGKINTMKIEKIGHGNVHANVCSPSQGVLDPTGDDWAVTGKGGVWVRMHKRYRRGLETPCKIRDGPEGVAGLSGLRVTCGVFDNGVPFNLTDSWQNRNDAHRELKRPWRGYTAFFDHECPNIDACSTKLCSLNDTHMTTRVQFQEHKNTYHDVVPYSETYHVHPHFILAACDNATQGPRWKSLPSRSDYFTGKSSAVMTARRQAMSKAKAKGARKRRRAIIQAANAELQRTEELGDIVMAHAPIPLVHSREETAFTAFSSGGTTRPSPFKASHSGGEEFRGNNDMDVDMDNSIGLPAAS